MIPALPIQASWSMSASGGRRDESPRAPSRQTLCGPKRLSTSSPSPRSRTTRWARSSRSSGRSSRARASSSRRPAEPAGFDDPRRLDAFLDAVRWGAVSTADVRALQSPFRSGIEIEDYQLDPVVRAIQMPRVNLLIADDVGLGKTIEAGLVAQELIIRHRARTDPGRLPGRRSRSSGGTRCGTSSASSSASSTASSMQGPAPRSGASTSTRGPTSPG